MATHRSEYYRLNGNTWDLHLFRTVANMVDETTDRIFTTPEDKAKISTYLNIDTFNTKGKLLQLDGTTGKIPVGLIPGGLNYLPLAGGTMQGGIELDGNNIGGMKLLTGYNNSTINFNEQGQMTIYIDGYTPYMFDNSAFRMGSKKITNLADPTAPTDAVTRQWVEQLIAQGTHVVGAVRASSTGNITSSNGTFSGEKTIDGVILLSGDRVLLKNQTIASEDGVYIVSKEEAWTKVANDSDKGSLVFTLDGNKNKGVQYYYNGVKWVEFFVQDTYHAADGGGLALDSSGFGFKIADGGIVNKMIKDADIDIAKLAVFPSNETHNWIQMSSAAAKSTLSKHLTNLYSAITLLRGHGSYKVDNQETIAGAYAHANTKSRVVTGTAVPSTTTGYNTGDIYLRTLS